MARILPPYLLRSINSHQIFRKGQLRKDRSFIKDKVIELGQKTLTGRLLAYLNSFNNQDLKQNECIPKLDEINLKDADLRHCDLEQIKTSFKLLNVSQDNFYLFKAIDNECHTRVKYMKTSDIFELLHVYMTKVPNRIINYIFYQSAMIELSKRLKFLTKNDIVQFIFYIGMRKKISKEHEVIRKCVNNLISNNLDSLTAEDLCVICNTTFKTTTKIKTEQLFSTIISYLYNHLELFKDPALFITLLKTIRQNRYQDEDLLATMTCTIFFNKTVEHYSFPALAHILAVYSDFLYYEESILNVFTERCLGLLKDSSLVSKKEHMSTNIRLKDINRFLWCLSNLNYKLDVNDINTVIIPNILKRVKYGDVKDDYSSLIEITLYLWMLNFRAYELVPYILNQKLIRYVNTLTTPLKQRFNLLLSCMYYEEKELLKDLNLKPTLIEFDFTRQLEKRPLLQQIMSHLNTISPINELNRFELSSQIAGVNIIGITGYKKDTNKAVHIEILDEYTTLKNTENVATGLMQLKLRLLDQSDEAVILVESDELKFLNDNEVRELLLDEINFVC